MNKIEKMLVALGKEPVIPSKLDIEVINELARRQVNLELPADDLQAESFFRSFLKENISLATAEKAMKLLKAYLDKIKRDDLPETLLNLGLKKFKTGDLDVSIKNDIAVTIKKADLEKIYKLWKHLTKTKIIVSAEKGTDTRPLQLFLNKEKFNYEIEDTIHPQTLKKHVNDLRKEGKALPKEVQVFEYKNNIIKQEVKNGKGN